MTRNIIGKLFAALIITAIIPFSLSAQNVEEILKSHFKAIGQEKLEKIETATTTGSIAIMGNDAPMNTYFKKPDKVRAEINVMGMSIVSVYNGKVGYVSVPGQPLKEVTPEELKGMTGSTGLEDKLYQAKKDKAKITLVGKTQLDSASVYKLALVYVNGDSSFAYVDPKTYYVVKLESNKSISGTAAQIEETYSDFRTTDGITLPYSVGTSAMGQQVAMKLDKVTFNTPIDDKQFEKPAQ
jgi:outer membrane lipoprotein-sorting protein